jgi:hypothetical protein
LIRKLLEAGVQTDLIDLGVAVVADGETLTLERDAEMATVVLAGVVEASADGASLGLAGGRTTTSTPTHRRASRCRFATTGNDPLPRPLTCLSTDRAMSARAKSRTCS